jgi:hypothetical protein
MNMNGLFLQEQAPLDSFTPRRAQKGYSELNVNHIFTGMNQNSVSLSHHREFNHATALRASAVPCSLGPPPGPR